jgi:outer membrane protein assembly factor BamB
MTVRMRVFWLIASSLALVSCADEPCTPDAAAWDCGDACGPPGTLQWQRTLHNGRSLSASVTVDACDGVVVAGSVSPDSAEQADMFVARHDPDGVLVWQSVLEDPEGEDGIAATVPAPDGGVYVAGMITHDFINYVEIDTDTWVARLDRDGEPIWTRSFDDGDEARARDLALTPDGVVVADVSGLRWLSADGDLVRELPADPDALSEPRALSGAWHVASAADGRIAAQFGDALVLVDADGREQWRHEDAKKLRDLTFTPDGTLLALYGGVGGELHAHDPTGELLWVFPLTKGPDILLADARGVVLGGSDSHHNQARAWIAALDPDGRERWLWAIDDPVQTWTSSLAIAPDGSVLATVGLSNGQLAGFSDHDLWIGRFTR